MSGELRKRLAGIAGQLSVRLSRYADRLWPPYPQRGETTHRRTSRGEPRGDPMADPEMTEADLLACEWSDYRKGYGVSAVALTEAHKAFIAGWEAARGKSFEGGPLR